MGDRANVVVHETRQGDREAVFLYGHWSGYELPETVREALASAEGRNRWDDGPYLARIVFDTMTGLRGGETGFGIGTRMPDNEYDLIVLVPDEGRLYRLNRGRISRARFGALANAPSIGFAQYIATARTWDNLTESVEAVA